MEKIVFITQNTAPFRMKWLDALASDFNIVVYHLNDYHKTMNKKFISFFSDNITVKTSYINILGRKFFKIREILNEKPDLIFLDGYGFPGQILLILQLKLLRKKFIMSIDGGFIKEEEKTINKKLKNFCLSSPEAILSTSPITDDYIKYYSSGDRVIYRHLFSSFYTGDIIRQTGDEKLARRKKLGIADKFTVISVGRFIPVKGFDILIKAAGILGNKVSVYFVGGIPGDEYKKLVENLNNVYFIDFLDKDDLQEYYLASDVYVTASRGDVWGLTIGEAMACGLPVISSSRCIAGASMIENGENGFVVDDEEPSSYASCIQKLSEDTNLKNKITDNNYRLAEKYALNNAVRDDIEHLHEIIKRIKRT